MQLCCAEWAAGVRMHSDAQKPMATAGEGANEDAEKHGDDDGDEENKDGDDNEK